MICKNLFLHYLVKKLDFDLEFESDPELHLKSDPDPESPVKLDPDPKKIFSDPKTIPQEVLLSTETNMRYRTPCVE